MITNQSNTEGHHCAQCGRILVRRFTPRVTEPVGQFLKRKYCNRDCVSAAYKNAAGARPIRPLRFEGDSAFIQLTKGMEAVIDVADAHLVQDANWQAKASRGTFYAVMSTHARGGNPTTVRMHRVILGGDSDEIDHRDGDGLNNRRGNLRPATHAQNQWNAGVRADNVSGFKGVGRRRRDGKFSARIRVHGRLIQLGTFETPEAAHAAYANAAREHHGEFAKPADRKTDDEVSHALTL